MIKWRNCRNGHWEGFSAKGKYYIHKEEDGYFMSADESVAKFPTLVIAKAMAASIDSNRI